MILDDLFTAAEQQQLADQLETALRGLVDLLTDDGDLINTLIRIRDVAMPQALAALDAHDEARTAPQQPERAAETERLCGLRGVPVSSCTCSTHGGQGVPEEVTPPTSADPPDEGDATGHLCRDCGDRKPADEMYANVQGITAVCRSCRSAKISAGRRKAMKARSRESV